MISQKNNSLYHLNLIENLKIHPIYWYRLVKRTTLYINSYISLIINKNNFIELNKNKWIKILRQLHQ